MVFSSAIFLFFFLPVIFILYFLVPKKAQNILLLIASLLFYTWGEPRFILFVLASITIDYFIAKGMDTARLRGRKCGLAISLILNIGLLAYFKYANFFVENLQQWYRYFGLEPFAWSAVALPIGISFITFQKISYMVDVYRNTVRPQRKWHLLTLYILMFPQLIAGPIIRYNEIADQLTNRMANENTQDRLNGLFRFIIGLSKKVLIANVLAIQVEAVFATSPLALSTSTAWLGLLAYTFQIYFDFSGYSDMAIGLGQMLGFRFPENFNFPYIARSFTDFWHRWHITLSHWMKDYLYIPLGGNRVKIPRMYLNLIIVFFLSGLWHGAAWTFVMWGLYHGFFLILDKLCMKKWLQKAGSVPATLLTFLLVMIGWVIFRSDSLPAAGQYIGQLFSFKSIPDGIVFDNRFFVTLVVAAACSFAGLFGNLENFVNQWFALPHRFYVWILMAIVCAGFYLLNSCALLAGDLNPFIYFRF